MKTAIITGGAQGIGKGIVQALLAQSWRVAVIDRDAEAVRDLTTEMPSPHLIVVRADVASEKDVEKAFQKIATWQEGSGEQDGIDLLVSNAGMANPVSGPIEQLDLKKWQSWQDSHVTGAFLMVRSAVSLLRLRKGAIVMMASTRALQSEPHTEAYAAAKGAICAMTHALAISLGPDIRVNAILPGWIETRPWAKSETREAVEHRDIDREQHPAGRVGEPGDIAATVLFLASDGAKFITGQQITVDGGMTRKMIYAH
ncbi:NAD(P)-dependent dehydrogenase, short-chain alcohol dehydrogenase family [Sphingobium sp. AP50]|uniref:SDR family oxidoreductase n=1 Tax=Sphingobium sp. AP50 TaxID=1884369 RepID=UPI0008BD9F56|nr:SDR family oxidoreductase [Sphingobium sp. AP50]SEJ20128.1 NAD(P)-dependent dehydrogenase, short-chain alcohol dehydrogenase family [Sphingobium sp. AP50]